MTWAELRPVGRFAAAFGTALILLVAIFWFALDGDLRWYTYLSGVSVLLGVASVLLSARERIRRDDVDRTSEDGTGASEVGSSGQAPS